MPRAHARGGEKQLPSGTNAAHDTGGGEKQFPFDFHRIVVGWLSVKFH